MHNCCKIHYATAESIYRVIHCWVFGTSDGLWSDTRTTSVTLGQWTKLEYCLLFSCRSWTTVMNVMIERLALYSSTVCSPASTYYIQSTNGHHNMEEHSWVLVRIVDVHIILIRICKVLLRRCVLKRDEWT